MERDVNQALARDFGLNAEEYAKVLEILGHTPTLTELGVFSVMWSEHCSYKSSRVYLKQLPTSAPWVIHGPGENAGVVDIGAGLAAVFKMELHNHPSFIEPYQGAATGVGGILRDVFTMGARPIANLNALRFGDPAKAITKRIVNGVVRGIGGYGNCIGVPTVGGEVNFHRAYDGNPLVNAMTVGIARKDRIFLSTAAGVGNPVVYVGAKTGRDGIHGATMASAEFGTDAEEKRPTVQIGDPFTEKKLLEACLELMETDAIIAIQDMGAAGLTSSSVEMAGKGGVGIDAGPGPGAAARKRDDGVRDDAFGMAGTDADGAAAGARRRGGSNLREVGAGFRGDRPADRHGADRGAASGSNGGGDSAGSAGARGAAVSPAHGRADETGRGECGADRGPGGSGARATDADRVPGSGVAGVDLGPVPTRRLAGRR